MKNTGDTHVDRAINEIDAAMFSGDVFLDPEAARAFQLWLQRWSRGLLEIHLTPDEPDVPDPEDFA